LTSGALLSLCRHSRKRAQSASIRVMNGRSCSSFTPKLE